MRFELQPNNRDQPDSELIADLRRVAAYVAPKAMSGSDYEVHGRFSRSTVKNRFGSWNRALEAAGVPVSKTQGLSIELLISDIKRVAKELGNEPLTLKRYRDAGGYSPSALCRAFGSWPRALEACGLEPLRRVNEPLESLFENLEQVWRRLGRQPTTSDITSSISRYSAATYQRRFGTWRKALEAFVETMKEAEAAPSSSEVAVASGKQTDSPAIKKRTTTRTVNWRLRFLVLRRDGFRCKACGSSPASTPGVDLEVDHVIPWSDGGETVMENLQSLCSRCNGGKSNLAFSVD